MADAFSYHSAGLESPATKAVAVTPDDNADLTAVTRYLYVGGAGNISVILAGDTDPVTFTAVPVGAVLSIRAKRVMLTGTTATNLLALS